MSAKRGERVLGPYEQHNGWRVIEIDAQGKRTSSLFDTEQRAQRYVEILQAELATADHTTATALEQYTGYLTDKGNRPLSIEITVWAIEMFFPDAAPLHLLSAKRCAKLYDALRTTPRERTGKPPSADTHATCSHRPSRFSRGA